MCPRLVSKSAQNGSEFPEVPQGSHCWCCLMSQPHCGCPLLAVPIGEVTGFQVGTKGSGISSSSAPGHLPAPTTVLSSDCDDTWCVSPLCPIQRKGAVGQEPWPM